MNLLNSSTIVCSLLFGYEKKHIHFIFLGTRRLKTLREPFAQSFSRCVIKALPLFLNFSSTEQVYAVQFWSQLDQRACNNKTVASAGYILGILTVRFLNFMKSVTFYVAYKPNQK